jgi:hypothetical protein
MSGMIEQIKNAFQTSSLKLDEVSVGSYISLPIPTRRFGAPGCLIFVAPSASRAGKEPTFGDPDSFALLAGPSARPLLYAKTAALPLGDRSAVKRSPQPVQYASIDDAISATDALVAVLQECSAFLDGASAPAGLGERFLNALQRAVPAPMQPWYEAAAPDLFAWLGIAS